MSLRLKRIMTVLLIILGICLIAAAVSAVVCSVSVKATYYTEALPGIETPCRVVAISDLHSKEYGEDNERLISLIAEQKPDAIFCVGDMLSRDADSEDIERFAALVRRLREIAPVYCTIGNHEDEFYTAKLTDLKAAVEDAGGVFLNNEYSDVEIGGNRIRLVGLLGGNSPWLSYYSDDSDHDLDGTEYAFFEDLRSCELPTVYLAHMPNMMIFFEPWEEFRMDLVISAHVHGGLWRLPFVGGLISPSEGLFPEYDHGRYRFGDTDMILSSGLCGYDMVPRLFNRPEICVIDLVPEE